MTILRKSKTTKNGNKVFLEQSKDGLYIVSKIEYYNGAFVRSYSWKYAFEKQALGRYYREK